MIARVWVRIPRLVVALVFLGACGSETEAGGDGDGSSATGGAGTGGAGGAAGKGGGGFGGKAGSGGTMDSGGAGSGNTGGAGDGGVAGSAGRAGAAGGGAGGAADLMPCFEHTDCMASEGCLVMGGGQGRCLPVASSCASDAWMSTCSSCRSDVSDSCPCVDWGRLCRPDPVNPMFNPQCSDNGRYFLCFYFG